MRDFLLERAVKSQRADVGKVRAVAALKIDPLQDPVLRRPNSAVSDHLECPNDKRERQRSLPLYFSNFEQPPAARRGGSAGEEDEEEEVCKF